MLLCLRHSITVLNCVVAMSLQQLHMAPLEIVGAATVCCPAFVCREKAPRSVCSAGTTGDSHQPLSRCRATMLFCFLECLRFCTACSISIPFIVFTEYVSFLPLSLFSFQFELSEA